MTWRLRLERSVGSAASGGRVPPRPKPETPRSRVREARTQWLTASVRCLRVRGGRPAGRAQDCNPESKTNPWMAFSRCVLGRWSLIRRPQKHSFPQLCRSRPMGSTRFYPMGAHRCVPSTPPAPGSPGVSPHPGTIAIPQLQYHEYRSSSFPAMLVDPRVTFSFPVSVSHRRELQRADQERPFVCEQRHPATCREGEGKLGFRHRWIQAGVQTQRKAKPSRPRTPGSS